MKLPWPFGSADVACPWIMTRKRALIRFGANLVIDMVIMRRIVSADKGKVH